MIELNKDDYDQQILQKEGLFLVDFWSESCEDCSEIMPEIEALESEFGKDITFCKVNIKGNRRLAIREKVLGLPSVLIYRDGKSIASFSKEFTAEDLRKKIEELI